MDRLFSSSQIIPNLPPRITARNVRAILPTVEVKKGVGMYCAPCARYAFGDLTVKNCKEHNIARWRTHGWAQVILDDSRQRLARLLANPPKTAGAQRDWLDQLARHSSQSGEVVKEINNNSE